jgi:hypothetical protein
MGQRYGRNLELSVMGDHLYCLTMKGELPLSPVASVMKSDTSLSIKVIGGSSCTPFLRT